MRFTSKVKKVKWCIYIAPLSQVSKALYNDQFTPSGLEAYTSKGSMGEIGHQHI